MVLVKIYYQSYVQKLFLEIVKLSCNLVRELKMNGFEEEKNNLIINDDNDSDDMRMMKVMSA